MFLTIFIFSFAGFSYFSRGERPGDPQYRTGRSGIVHMPDIDAGSAGTAPRYRHLG